MIVHRKGVSREVLFSWLNFGNSLSSNLGLAWDCAMAGVKWRQFDGNFPLGKLWTWAPGGRQGQRATSEIAGSTQVVVGDYSLDKSQNYGGTSPFQPMESGLFYRMGRWPTFLFLQDVVMEFASVILERHAKEPLQKCHPCFPPFHATSMTGSDRLWRSLKTWMFLTSSKKQTEGVLQYYYRWWWSLKDFWFSPRKLGKISNLTSIFF